MAVAAALAIAVLAVYWPVLRQGFVDFDDPLYVQQNLHLRRGFTGETLRWAFTTFHAANWHPLTWLSHLADVRLYGLNPGGHHLTSLLLHLANTLLLFMALRALTGALWRSALVAALFSLHPLRVESVAWISERKDVLAAFFWMAAMCAYVWYTRRPGPRRFALVVVLFALGLLSKPMVVTLPFVFLLLDWWPLGRTGAGAAKLLGEKTFLFVMAFLSVGVTFLAQSAGGAVKEFLIVSPALRFANALVSYVAYLGDLVFPWKLAVFYPHPMGALPGWKIVSAAVLLLGISAAVSRLRSRRPSLAFGWLWYLGTLLPVIGLIQVGEQARADRYTYLPLVGLTVAAVWGVTELTLGRRSREFGLVALSAAVLAALAPATRAQVELWRNDTILFSHALEVTRDNWMMHYNIGNTLYRQGKIDEAEERYREALRLRPAYPSALNNLGAMLSLKGRPEEALACLRRALALHPSYAKAWYNLGCVLDQQGQKVEALAAFQRAVRSDPEHTDAWTYIGILLEGGGDQVGAAGAYRRVLSLDPDNARAIRRLKRLEGRGPQTRP